MKPSIFSSDYKNKIRKRKKTIRNIFILLIILLIILFFSGTIRKHVLNSLKSFPNYFGSTFKNQNITEVKSNKPKPNDVYKEPVSNNSSGTTNTSSTNQVDTGYDITLSDGQNIKVLYSDKGSTKKFIGISPANSYLYYNISPSCNGMVILDKKSQHIIYVDISGNVGDVTKKEYKSTGGSTFTEEEYLAENPSYIWADIPTFIDDDKIAFVSQMPQFYRDKTTKYVWVYDIKSKDYNLKEDLNGESIKFSTLNDNGLQINVDNRIKFLKSNGDISE